MLELCVSRRYPHVGNPGIRSLDESSHLDQSEAVKVARAFKQISKMVALPPRPHVVLCLIVSKINPKIYNPPPNTLDF